MSKRDTAVPRPIKKSEYQIRFGTHAADKGWQDMLAAARNAVVEAWDFLTRNPHERCERCYPLSGEMATVTLNGVTFTRWQYKVTDGGRIWFVVGKSETHAGTVIIEAVHAGHPTATDSKKVHRK